MFVKLPIQEYNFTTSALNISNIAYHKFFTTDPSFQKTHLADPNPLSPYLLNKIEAQKEQIIATASNYDIQIIIEGYYDFFMDLSQRISPSYKLISKLDEPNHPFTSSPKNIVGLLINTSKVKIIKSGIVSTSIPWAHLEYNGRSLIIMGVHVQGCKEQFPKENLESLSSDIKIMKDLYPTADIICMGDFNTVPENIRSVLKNVTLVPPKYPTHMNPRCDVVAYDNCVYNFYNADADIEFVPIDSNLIPSDSRAFVKCLMNQIK